MTIRTFLFLIDTPTSEIYTLSLHDALPISNDLERMGDLAVNIGERVISLAQMPPVEAPAELAPMAEAVRAMVSKSRSEEHTSELQSHSDLVCRLLLEKKKKKQRDCTALHHI